MTEEKKGINKVEKNVSMTLSATEYNRLQSLLAGETRPSKDDREPLPEDAVPIGEKIGFWHMDRAVGILKTKGYLKLLTGIKHLSNAGGMMRRLDDQFRGVQEHNEPGPCTGIEFFGTFEPKILRGRETKGISIMVRKGFAKE